jgi:hypothetical protein
MTEKEAQRELGRIEAELENAIAQLVKTPAAADSWPVALKAALTALQRVRAQFPVPADRRALRPLLQSIEKRVKQVQALVDSAAIFYFGCVAVTRTQGVGYTHEGALEEFAVGGRMQLEA